MGAQTKFAINGRKDFGVSSLRLANVCLRLEGYLFKIKDVFFPIETRLLEVKRVSVPKIEERVGFRFLNAFCMQS